MRILHVTPDYHPAKGGGEFFIKEVSERLAARGHQVTVLAMNSRGMRREDGARLPRREAINGVRVHRFNHTYQMHQRFFGLRGAHRTLALAFDTDARAMLSATPCSAAAFLATLRIGADVVSVINWYHGSLAYQTAIARQFGRFALVGIPLFHTERPWAHSPLLAQALHRCDAVAVMTEHERNFVHQAAPRAQVHVVGAGVDPAWTTSPGDARRVRAQYALGDSPVIGYVGRMSSTKGVVSLVQAMQLVWREAPSARLLLAGTGLPTVRARDEQLWDTFSSLSSAERERIVVIERLTEEQKPAVFAAMDIFAMPSVAESFGIAYLEAWLQKRPVIGGRIGATSCVIDDGVDGRLVHPDQRGELASSILTLIASREDRERLGAAGYEKCQARFTWSQVTDRLEEAYKQAYVVRLGTLRQRTAVA
jgi:glycosyltransferase involved in cell wall biosynthesis